MKLVWDDTDAAELPNGGAVAIHSEHVRGEPRFYWPMYRPPVGEAGRAVHTFVYGGQTIESTDAVPMPTFPGSERYDGGTKAKAKRWAQAYADYLEEALDVDGG